MTPREKLLEAIAVFRNKTPEEIATILVAARAKGQTCLSNKCPLAMYLKKVAKEEEIYVYGDRCYVYRHKAVYYSEDLRLGDFVRQVDEGHFPQLEK